MQDFTIMRHSATYIASTVGTTFILYINEDLF